MNPILVLIALLIVAVVFLTVGFWLGLTEEPPPPHNPDSADYKKGT